MALKNVKKLEAKSIQTGNNTTAAPPISQKISTSRAHTISNAKYYTTVNHDPNAHMLRPENNSQGVYLNQMTTTMATFSAASTDHT